MNCPSCRLEFDEQDAAVSRMTFRAFRCPICAAKVRYDYASLAELLGGAMLFGAAFLVPDAALGFGYTLPLAFASAGLVLYVHGFSFRQLVRDGDT